MFITTTTTAALSPCPCEEGMIVALEAVTLLLIITTTSLAAATASGASVSSGSPSFGLSDWIRRAKFGRSTDGRAVSPVSQSSSTLGTEEASPSVWVYQGALYDLLNGQHIANVHGVELIRPLAQYDASATTFSTQIQRRQKDAFLAKCRDLQVGKIMQEYWKGDTSSNRSHHQEHDAVDVTTAWSRKLFCYQAPDDSVTTASGSSSLSSSSSSHLLNSIRLRPTAPRRNVPPSQAMASYDTIVSYITPSAHRNTTEESHVLLHTEFPNRQTVHGLAYAKQSQPNALDLNIFTRPSAATNQQRQQTTLQLQSLLFPQTSTMNSKSNNSTSSSPPRIKRSSLVQFGMSAQTALHRYGARESYSFQVRQSPKRNSQAETSSSGWFRNRFAKSSKMTTTSDAATTASPTTTTTATVRYTRQGEGPPWYGPNRLCTLELHGQRLDNPSELEKFFGKQQQQQPDNIPAICQRWAQRAMNDWTNGQIMARNEMEQFYNTSGREAVVGHLLQLSRSPTSTASDDRRWQKAVHQGQLLWQRLSSSLSTHTLHRHHGNNDD